jgi:RNA polymerase sigma-70 factor (ECF subfamily)
MSLRERRFVTNWDQIVSDHSPRLLGLASRILGGGNDAEDVVQEAFFEAYQLQRGQAVDNWGGLLCRIVTHRAVDRLRKRRATVSLDGVEPSARTHNPEHAAIGRELGERLRRAIGELPERQAAVFCLRYFDDLSYAQIAEALGIDPSAVATALNKARVKLKSLLTA